MFNRRILRLSCGLAVLACMSVQAMGQTRKIPAGLHIPKGNQRNFNITLRDGAGHQWQFQRYLNVYGGINYIYSGGLYCQINGSNVRSNNNMVWMNKAGDEVEIGPYTRNNCQIYRRAKVYRNQSLTRWMDIFVNTTSSKQVVPVRIYSSLNRNVSRTITSSGANTFGKKDWAFITEHQNVSLLHVVCGKRSKLRPTVNAGGNTIYANYSVTVPPGGVAILSYFEAQGNSTSQLQKTLSQFNARKMFSDLPSAVRRLIVNFRSGGGIEDIELDRSGTADVVIRKNGDVISGKIANKEFVIEPFFGKLTLPAKDVIGFVAVTGQESTVHAIVTGGQVITGKLTDAVITLTIPTGGELKIPFSRIKECSYRISKARPDDSSPPGPLIVLRTGDRLAFDPADLKCTFKTRHGPIKLLGKDLTKILLDHKNSGVHRARFVNGSMLAGILGPEKIVLPLKLGPELNVSRNMILAIYFAEKEEENSAKTHVILNNEDELFGRLVDKAFELVTDFGTISVKPENITEISFSVQNPGQATIKMWDGSTLQGKLSRQTLRFAVQPGPELDLHVGHIVEIIRPNALPPDTTVKLVEKYIAMLSAANYKDRQEAQEELIRMGPTIAPLLREHVKDPDPEVRQRIRNILDKLGAQVPGAGKTPPHRGPNVVPFRGKMMIGG